MTHLLDTSAVLAQVLDEPGADRVDQVLSDASSGSGVSVLTPYELWTAYRDRMGSEVRASEAVLNLRHTVSEVVPVDETIIDLAIKLRRAATARIALADCLIAATAANRHAVLHSRPSLRGGDVDGRRGYDEDVGRRKDRRQGDYSDAPAIEPQRTESKALAVLSVLI